MPLEILSLGAGVQSSCLFLMSLYGDLPPFDYAIFSDTGWEPAGVYEHLERLHEEAAKFGRTIDVVSAGNIRDDHVNPQRENLFIRKAVKYPHYQGKQRTFIPFFVISEPTEDNPSGKGKTFRTCTKTYKIEPIEKRVREILGLKPNQRWPLHHVVNQSMGISWDEAQRERKSDRPAIVHCYPLLDRKMTRQDCIDWLTDHGWDAPRSACIGCPFHRNDEWRRMRDEDPAAWKDAIDFDHEFRQRTLDGLTSLHGVPYLHDSRVPLDEADIDEVECVGSGIETTAEAMARERALTLTHPSLFDTMFGEHCDGFCGT